MVSRTIILKTKDAECPITVGMNLGSETLAAIASVAPENIAVIADSTTARLWSEQVLSLIQK